MGDSDALHQPSLPDHASYGHQGVNDQWVRIQRSTFTNWIQDQLTGVQDADVSDLQTDFADGTRLCAVVEALGNRRIPHVIRKPVNQHQRLDNINLALRAMQEDDIKLVNIGAEDIHGGNLKLILGLVWRLILRYQIGRAKTPAKKLMLAWINAVLPNQRIANFSTDWNDGKALHGVIEYCRPGTFSNWRQLNPQNGLQNCQKSMDTAKQLFSIPLVLKPENLSSPDLDELSGMTYLSYFMKVNSPGYNATLKWVKEQLPNATINNFQTDWNDGRLLNALMRSVGVTIAGPDIGSDVDRLQRALNAAKQHFDMDPVITAKEMADPDVDHLGVMAYCARLQAAVTANKRSVVSVQPSAALAKTATATPLESKSGERTGQERMASPLKQIQILPPRSQPFVGQRCSLYVNLNPHDTRSIEALKVEIVGPTTRPNVTLYMTGDQGLCDFTPLESGPYRITVYRDDEMVSGSPLVINVLAAQPPVTLVPPINEGQVGKLVQFQFAFSHNSASWMSGNSWTSASLTPQSNNGVAVLVRV